MEKKKDPERSRAFRELCRLTGQAVGRYRMITGGERILIGVSGGKDSLILAHVLYAMRRRSPVPFALYPAVFDPGFPEFGLERLRSYCAQQGWPLQVVSLPVADIVREKAVSTPCMLCARLRRGKLYGLAAELRCGHLALGQHLDDALASFLMSFCRGQGLTTMGPNVPAEREPVRIIRPLILAPEELIREAAAEFAFPDAGKCVYAEQLEANGDRAYFKHLVEQLEQRMPHVRAQMLHSLSRLQPEYLLDPRFLADRPDPEVKTQ